MSTKVSIIVPVYNGGKALTLCLDSLMSLDYPKEDLEIIVVDNNSTDTTKDIIRKYKVKYLFEPKRGAPLALNRGIQNSRGEIIAFTHSDCVARRNWMKNMVTGFNDNDIGGCGGDALVHNPQSYIEKYCDYRRLYFQNGNVAKQKNFLPWINIVNGAFRRDVLDEVGLFDEFFIQEYEIDLSWRVYLRGYQLKYVPDAVVYHKYRDTLAGLWQRDFWIAYNSPRFVKKYGKIYESLYIVPYKDFPYVFWNVLCALGGLFRNLFNKKDRFEKLFPLLDIVVYLVFFLGSIYGWVILKLKGKNIRYQSLEPYNKIFSWNYNEEIVILNPKKGSYYNLEGISKRIWEMLSEGRNLDEIINIISDEYEKDKEELRKDCINFIDELKQASLIGL
ncbi:MAG: PqqD family peptide modification chaperone [Candidatus Omnitrophota bacterium]|nr:PqqD family peptide modification chaperone [Candidatus Omnitrophota bacterium]